MRGNLLTVRTRTGDDDDDDEAVVAGLAGNVLDEPPEVETVSSSDEESSSSEQELHCSVSLNAAGDKALFLPEAVMAMTVSMTCHKASLSEEGKNMNV